LCRNDTRALTVLRISYRQNTSELEETVGILSGRLEAQDKELMVFKDQLKVAQDQFKLALGAHQEEILSFKEQLQVAEQEAALQALRAQQAQVLAAALQEAEGGGEGGRGGGEGGGGGGGGEGGLGGGGDCVTAEALSVQMRASS
jgi:uncharacterized membrane protein YgcG